MAILTWTGTTPNSARQLGVYFDAKAHRRERLFEIKALHIEDAVPVTDTLVRELAQALTALARWHHTAEVTIRQSVPPTFCPALREALNEASQPMPTLLAICTGEQTHGHFRPPHWPRRLGNASSAHTVPRHEQ